MKLFITAEGYYENIIDDENKNMRMNERLSRVFQTKGSGLYRKLCVVVENCIYANKSTNTN